MRKIWNQVERARSIGPACVAASSHLLRHLLAECYQQFLYIMTMHGPLNTSALFTVCVWQALPQVLCAALSRTHLHAAVFCLVGVAVIAKCVPVVCDSVTDSCAPRKGLPRLGMMSA